jgi:nucleoid-associated protein YgaU
MRRIVTCLWIGAFALTLTACKSNDGKSWFGKKSDATAEVDPYAPADSSLYDPVVTSSYPAYDERDYAAMAPVEQTYRGSAEPAMDDFADRYHTVVKNDTLYGIARTYYGDQGKWKDIFEANRGEITDPNRIRVGQRLLIP